MGQTDRTEQKDRQKGKINPQKSKLHNSKTATLKTFCWLEITDRCKDLTNNNLICLLIIV